jgi:hypothetical protein
MPEQNEIHPPLKAEDLLDTRAGLALANAAFGEGLSAGIKACNEAEGKQPFVKPESPYSAPLLAMVKAGHDRALPITLPDRDEIARELFIADNAGAQNPGHEWEILKKHSKYTKYVFDLADVAIEAFKRANS